MTRIALRVLAAAALGISSYVHLHVAHLYGYGNTITGTDIFRAQGVVAAVVAVVLLLTGNRWVWVLAALLGLASFGAVMTYRYVDVGAIGPMPNMYEPVWYAEKSWSAIGEAIALGAALLIAGERVVTARRHHATAHRSHATA